MTKQEYYDLLVVSTLDGTFPGYDGYGCKYRTPNGKKCAVGILIPDNKYCDELESRCLYSLVKDNIVNIPEGLNRAAVCEMQSLHDGAVINQKQCHGDFVAEMLNRINNFTAFIDVQQVKGVPCV